MSAELIGMVLRLLLAGVLGGLIGFERETHGRPAGLRTHILVSLGAALFTIVSGHYSGPYSDPSRIASQIVTGIGFLGAGTIIRQGSIVRGLTTAASLWTTAAIGMAIGSDSVSLIYLAIVASIIVFITLSLISRFEHALVSRRQTRDLTAVLPGGRPSLTAVIGLLDRFHVAVQGIRVEEIDSGAVEAKFRLRLPADLDTEAINAELANLPQIRSFDWE